MNVRVEKVAFYCWLLSLCFSGSALAHEANSQSAQVALVKEQQPESYDAVVVTESESEYTLSNGIITARISKQSGMLKKLTYQGRKTIARGYWSHDTRGGVETSTRISIDPATNDGERAEVSVKGISGGIKMGHGPGAGPDGDFPADIEIRYCLERGQTGIYTYCVFEHLPEYSTASMAEARYCMALDTFFDWICVDEKRNRHYPKPIPEEDKYVYTAVQSENRAFGFYSTTDNSGCWMINPSMEYMSGGPTKVEFLCHRHTDSRAAPVVLNYWRSSHYGGANVSVVEGEQWSKVIGPFMLYVNNGPDADTAWDDAKEQARLEKKKWPYAWVSGVDYPHRDHRSSVSGTIRLNDPLMPGVSRFDGDLTVGLAHAPYSVPSRFGGTREINWQQDAKHYQFWAKADSANGQFTIPDVRPGSYSLYAFADGVLGEFIKADVEIEDSGEAINLGELEWTPVRRGRQLWDIGIANRTATEFCNGDRYFDPGIQIEYSKLFPQDVRFTVGKSDFSKDWYFQHIPHNEKGDLEILPYRGVKGKGRATPFTVDFDLEDTPAAGTGTLRLAICGTGTKRLHLQVNGTAVGAVPLGFPDGVITRHQVQGIWYERELLFDASLLKQGRNKLSITVPAGLVNSGVVYDYLRLELDEEN